MASCAPSRTEPPTSPSRPACPSSPWRCSECALSCAWARMLLRISGVKVRIQGLERLDLNACYVFFGNHVSLMDTPVVLGSIPVRFLFMANRKYFKIPFLGTHLRRAGHLPVVTSDPRASLRSMSDAAH